MVLTVLTAGGSFNESIGREESHESGVELAGCGPRETRLAPEPVGQQRQFALIHGVNDLVRGVEARIRDPVDAALARLDARFEIMYSAAW